MEQTHINPPPRSRSSPMSALTLALEAFSARSSPSLSPDVHHTVTPSPTSSSTSSSAEVSPASSYSPLPSLTNSSSSSLCAPQPLRASPTRPNEHLAVLLPNQLWKPDSLASQCDRFFCRVRFSIFERRHHCRKCGGIFCGTCTSRTTPLLDTSNLSFLHPPRNVPLSSFASPSSPILAARVCDDCWDQIHGSPSTPCTPDLVHPNPFASPISVLNSPLSPSSGESSLSSSVVATPPNGLGLFPSLTRKTRSLRTAPSISSLSSTATTPIPASRCLSLRTSHLALATPESLLVERSYGELDAYPLKRSSQLCKATGGGRWEPKQSPVLVGYRVPVPGGKAPYELEMEREEAAERVRRENPVVKDGDFQYRFPRDPEPKMTARTPFQLSTF